VRSVPVAPLAPKMAMFIEGSLVIREVDRRFGVGPVILCYGMRV
jgi:hypothetical protein